MRKVALFLSLLLSFFIAVPRVLAYEAAPWVLAVQTTSKPAVLPKIMTGQKLVVAGESGDLILLGGQVDITGDVLGNVIAVGGKIILEPNARVTGYLLSAGGQVELLGRVDGNTKVISGEATIGPKSYFGGDLSVDANKISAPATAKVMGTKRITEIKSNGKMPWGYWNNALPQKRPGLFAGVFTAVKVFEFIGKVILMLIFIKLMGGHLAELTKKVKADFWRILGWGALKLFLTPILIILLLMSVIGIPIAMLFVGLYIGAIFLSGYISGAILGHWLVMKGWLKNKDLYVQGAVGLLVLEVVGLIPVVGWLVKLGAVLVGLGLVVRWEKSLLSLKG